MHMFLPSYFVFRSKKKILIQNKEKDRLSLNYDVSRNVYKWGEKGNIDNQKGDLFWQDNKEEMVWKNVKFFIIKRLKRWGVLYNDNFLTCWSIYITLILLCLYSLTLLIIKRAIWSWTFLEHINLLKKKSSLKNSDMEKYSNFRAKIFGFFFLYKNSL